MTSNVLLCPASRKSARFLVGGAISLAVALMMLLHAAQLSAEEVLPAKDRGTALEPSAPTSEQIDRWIAELSHDAYTVRQAAAAQLLAAGMAARAPLVAVADGPDPEIRAAARRLVALIDQSEFHRRLSAFAADTDGRRGLTLPGWEQFRDLVGEDPAARALFVEMQRQEAPLLAAVFGISIQPPEQLWEDRLLRLVQWQATAGDRNAPPLGSCATMLFLGTAEQMAAADRGAMLLENLIQRPPLRESLTAAEPNDALRRLVIGWILNCPNKNELILRRRLNLISMLNLKAGLPLALAVIGDPQYAGVPPETRAAAALLVGQFGSEEHVEQLEPLLEDSSICIPVQNRNPGQRVLHVQVRDVALVVLLHLTGQRPADYGYLHARLQPQQTFHLQMLHRENDRQREEAIAKWRAWRAATKKQNSAIEQRNRADDPAASDS